ncbi:hypothetical protein TNCV_3555741 [Trichonephila clavipes]|nr:hypothetical protein TNCV_3555741 [Trichonephila clavipes]
MKKVAPPPPPVAKAPPPPLSNGSVRRTNSGDQQQSRPPLHTTTPGEDCAFDELLEGRMDLEVVLPDLKVVRMNVDRRCCPLNLTMVQYYPSSIHNGPRNLMCSDFAEWGRKISPGGHTNTESRFAPKLLFLYPVNDKDMRMV